MMILCLTGTNPYSFERLIKYVDVELGSKHQVKIQIGNTECKPEYSEFFNFCDRDEIFSLINKADVVISQGGYGSMMDVLSLKKTLIAVPRYKELNESQDHQKELVDYFAQKGFLIPCYKIEDLKELVEKAFRDEFKLVPYKTESDLKVSEIIKNFITDNNL